MRPFARSPEPKLHPSSVPLALAICGGMAAACGSDFAERSEIEGLRFLAVQASPPTIIPGETSRLSPLVVGQDPGRTLQYRWSWCPLRGPNSAQFECLVTVEQLNEAIGGAGGAVVGPEFFELGTNPTADFVYAFPPEIVRSTCEALRSRPDVTNLVTLPECDDGSFPVSVRVDVTDGETTITAFKNLRLVYDLSATRSLNTNPDISMNGIRTISAGGAVASQPLAYDTTYLLELGPDPDSEPLALLDRLSETYTATRTEANDDNETIEIPFETREQLILSWFAFTGSFDDNRTGFLPQTLFDPVERPDAPNPDEAWRTARTNEWTTPRRGDFAGGPTTLYLVVRDERGGTAWTSTTVTIGTETP